MMRIDEVASVSENRFHHDAVIRRVFELHSTAISAPTREGSGRALADASRRLCEATMSVSAPVASVGVCARREAQ